MSESKGQDAHPLITTDEQRLHELGYNQELRRLLSPFYNFAFSLTVISVLSGCFTLYGFAMNTGGPLMITWGWPFVGLMTLVVGLAMAEVCSSFPTAAGLYYWSAKLAPKNAPAWAWFTGWFNTATGVPPVQIFVDALGARVGESLLVVSIACPR